MQKIDRILVVAVVGIGDTVMSVPALRALRQNYPQAYIAVLVSERSVELLQDCPFVNEIFTFCAENFKISRMALRISKSIGFLGAVYSLRKKNFDLAVNLYDVSSFSGSLRMRILFKLIQPRLSAGRNSLGRGNFFSINFKQDQLLQHEVQTQLGIIQLLQTKDSNSELELWPRRGDEQVISELFLRLKIEPGDFLIGINPNAKKNGYLWPQDQFARVADRLIEEYQAKLILLGAFSDRKRIQKIISGMKNVSIDLSGKLALPQYVSLIRRLKLFITLDSGPMHIASVFKIPTIALFGASDPVRFGPYLNDRAVILQKKVGCNPCNDQVRCSRQLCMEAITIDDVLTAFLRLREQL